MNDIAIRCENIGVSGTTDCFIKKTNTNEYEARIGIAIMGTTNMNEAMFKIAENNPFNPNFFDNYAVGIGATKEEAIENMKKSIKDIANSLHAF
jgi:hypothetical protein